MKYACLFLPAFIAISYIPKSMAMEGLAHPFYFGLGVGAGTTTWNGIVPPKKNQNLAMKLSTPTSVEEGGAVWSAFAGYEFGPHFAIETNYIQYPTAEVTFDKASLFSFLNDGETKLSTHTETLNLMLKVMLTIPNTEVRAFTSAGAAGIHRSDVLYDSWQLTPTFGFGFNRNLTPHVLTEIVANYTAGYGESQLNPSEVYVPFLYSVMIHLAYRV